MHLFKRPLFFLLLASLASPASAERKTGTPADEGGSFSSSDALPLILISRSEAAASPDGTVRFRYRNAGDRPIVAWDFRCTVATQDGRSGWIGGSTDAFSLLMVHQDAARQDAARGRLVLPGETVERAVGTDFRRDGPFAVQVCGPTAVIFDDGSYAGAAASLDELFARRRALVGELRVLAERLNRLETDGPAVADRPHLDELHQLAVRLGGLYVPAVERLQTESASSLALGELRDLRRTVEADYERALAQLRVSDRRLLEGGRP